MTTVDTANNRIPETPPVIVPIADTTNRPLWSVMIPSYNCILYLQEAIESVLIQDPGADKMQIEVVDDCSTDGDIEALVTKIGKGRVKFFRQRENKGSLRNFETCLNRSTGKWVHILHGDDRAEPGFYKEIEELFSQYPQAGAAFTRNSFINKNGQLLRIKLPLTNEPGMIKNFLSKIAIHQRLDPPAIVVKRSVYEQLGGFFGVHYGEDWEMWTRIAAHFPVAYSPKCLAAYRELNTNNASSKSILTGQNIKDMIKVINTIENYLPSNQRKTLKNKALEHYAIYNIRIANGLLSASRQTAWVQAMGALQMRRSIRVIYWFIRFCVLHLSGLKDFQNRIKKAKTSPFYSSVQ